MVPPAIHTTPYISDRSIYVNETVTVRFSMRRLSGSSGNGGITVSFPDLDQANSLQSSSSYDSADGGVSTWNYTNGSSKVRYFPSGYSPIHLANGGTDIARYLIVETDDTDWPDTNSLEDHRTLELRVTPKREMTFRIYYRFWLCRSGYDDCARHPGSTRVDQQGWNVGVYYVTVRNRAPSVARGHALGINRHPERGRAPDILGPSHRRRCQHLGVGLVPGWRVSERTVPGAHRRHHQDVHPYVPDCGHIHGRSRVHRLGWRIRFGHLDGEGASAVGQCDVRLQPIRTDGNG